MKNLTPELIAKAKAAKSTEELLALAKENNVELTEEEAKTYFEQLNANGAAFLDLGDVLLIISHWGYLLNSWSHLWV